jgi:hypothetical protein
MVQAYLGLLIVGTQLAQHWRAFDLFDKSMGVFLIVALLLSPTTELWRKRSGKDVRFSNLAAVGYTLVWITAITFGIHSH